MSTVRNIAVFTNQDYTSLLASLDSLKLNDLKRIAKALSVAQSGRKAEVNDRIKRYVQTGKDSNDIARLRAIEHLTNQLYSNVDYLPDYESVYAEFKRQIYGSGQIPMMQQQTTNIKKPWIFFKENPFFVLKKLMTPNAGHCYKAPNGRGTCTITFTLNQNDYALLSKNEKFRLYLLSGAYDKFKSTTDVPMEFPQPIELHFNSVQIRDNIKGIKNKPGTAKPANLTPHILPVGRLNRLDIVYAFTKVDYLMFCYLIELVPPEKLLSKILANEHISKQSTVLEITKSNNPNSTDDEDEEIQEVSSKLTLKCPLSFTRLTYPVKSINCKHLPCFDALSFLQLQEQSSTWVCPVCAIPVKIKDLAIDDYTFEILRNTPKNVNNVELEADGNWKPIVEEDDDDSEEDDGTPVVELEDDDSPKRAAPPPKKKAEPIVISLDSDDEDFMEAPAARPAAQPVRSASQPAPVAPPSVSQPAALPPQRSQPQQHPQHPQQHMESPMSPAEHQMLQNYQIRPSQPAVAAVTPSSAVTSNTITTMTTTNTVPHSNLQNTIQENDEFLQRLLQEEQNFHSPSLSRHSQPSSHQSSRTTSVSPQLSRRSSNHAETRNGNGTASIPPPPPEHGSVEAPQFQLPAHIQIPQFMGLNPNSNSPSSSPAATPTVAAPPPVPEHRPSDGVSKASSTPTPAPIPAQGPSLTPSPAMAASPPEQPNLPPRAVSHFVDTHPRNSPPLGTQQNSPAVLAPQRQNSQNNLERQPTPHQQELQQRLNTFKTNNNIQTAQPSTKINTPALSAMETLRKNIEKSKTPAETHVEAQVVPAAVPSPPGSAPAPPPPGSAPAIPAPPPGPAPSRPAPPRLAGSSPGLATFSPSRFAPSAPAAAAQPAAQPSAGLLGINIDVSALPKPSMPNIFIPSRRNLLAKRTNSNASSKEVLQPLTKKPNLDKNATELEPDTTLSQVTQSTQSTQ